MVSPDILSQQAGWRGGLSLDTFAGKGCGARAGGVGVATRLPS